MFGIILLRALSLGLMILAVFIIRSHFKKNQVQKRVLNQIKHENRIWNEVLKGQDINQA